MARVPAYLIPLNVKTYSQGFLRLQGWIAFSLVAFVTAGLLVTYELLVLNVEDQDFRDLLFDYRITRPGISYQHKQFANAQFCCHVDDAVFNSTCSAGSLDYLKHFGPIGPGCPPVIEFTCTSLTSATCNQVVPLTPHITPATRDKYGEFGWPWELWPWPPSSSCSNTGTPAAMYLAALLPVSFDGYVTNASSTVPPPFFRVDVLQESLVVPQYEQLVHLPSVRASYAHEVWKGSPEELQQAWSKPVQPLPQNILISLHDVSEPQPLALPKYQGELYIYVALVMGAIWMFSSVPLVFLFGLIVVSDRGMKQSDFGRT
eukprot:gene8415-8599_t